MPSLILFSILAYAGPLLVGTVFLATGVAKALFPTPFGIHLSRLRLLPRWSINPATGLFIAGECALGIALVLRIAPVWLFPATLVLLLLLAALTYWATASGRVQSCGCYGGLVELTPRLSLMLNAAYAVLMGLACFAGSGQADDRDVLLVKAAAVAAVFGLGLLLTLGCHLYFVKLGRPVLDHGPMKIGRRWQAGWLNTAGPDLAVGAHVVAFLAKGCPACKSIHGLLHALHERADLPAVQGVVSAEVGADHFTRNDGMRVPLTAVPKARLIRLVYAYPTVLLVADGVIRAKWVGLATQAALERLVQSPDPLRGPSPAALETPVFAATE